MYKSGGKYTVTSLGKIAYGVVQRIAALEKDYWKFVAIDTFRECCEYTDIRRGTEENNMQYHKGYAN